MKKQAYSVKFSSSQSGVANALAAYGGLFNAAYKDHGPTISKHYGIGNVADDVLSLSEDGMVMTVERRMTDSCYTDLRKIFSDDSLYSISQASSLVDSVSSPPYFVDI